MFQVLTTVGGDGLAHDDRKLATMVTIEGDSAHIGGHGTCQQRQCGDCAGDVVHGFLAAWQIMPAHVANGDEGKVIVCLLVGIRSRRSWLNRFSLMSKVHSCFNRLLDKLYSLCLLRYLQ